MGTKQEARNMAGSRTRNRQAADPQGSTAGGANENFQPVVEEIAQAVQPTLEVVLSPVAKHAREGAGSHSEAAGEPEAPGEQRTRPAVDVMQVADLQRVADAQSTAEAQRRAEAECKEAEDRQAREEHCARMEEERIRWITNDLAREQKASEEQVLRTQALVNLARKEAECRQRLQVAKGQQEILQKQLETLRRAGIPEHQALGFEEFYEEPPVISTRRKVDMSSPLPLAIQVALWPPRLAGVKLPMFAGVTDPREFFIRYETTVESAE